MENIPTARVDPDEFNDIIANLHDPRKGRALVETVSTPGLAAPRSLYTGGEVAPKVPTAPQNYPIQHPTQPPTQLPAEVYNGDDPIRKQALAMIYDFGMMITPDIDPCAILSDNDRLVRELMAGVREHDGVIKALGTPGDVEDLRKSVSYAVELIENLAARVAESEKVNGNGGKKGDAGEKGNRSDSKKGKESK